MVFFQGDLFLICEMYILVPNCCGEQSRVEEQSMTNDMTEKSNQMLLLDKLISLSNYVKWEMRNYPLG